MQNDIKDFKNKQKLKEKSINQNLLNNKD